MSTVNPIDELNALIARARAGDQEAAAGLVRRWRPAIRAVARRRLRARPVLRRAIDSNDLAQEAWTTFFTRVLSKKALSFNDEQTFICFLSRLVANCTRASTEHYLEAKKRDLSREVPLRDNVA